MRQTETERERKTMREEDIDRWRERARERKTLRGKRDTDEEENFIFNFENVFRLHFNVFLSYLIVSYGMISPQQFIVRFTSG